MPELYMIIARKKYFPEFLGVGGGGTLPSHTSMLPANPVYTLPSSLSRSSLSVVPAAERSRRFDLVGRRHGAPRPVPAPIVDRSGQAPASHLTPNDQ